MTNSVKNKRVFVGLSGGVDSSVAAALLQKEGYDVTGVFIKVWQPDFLPCPWREERLDAMRVAAHLRIPLLTFDFEKEYKQYVVDYMLDEYRAGRTPNPDVMCNKSVKFGAFLHKAQQMGAHFVATGHYARREENGVIKLLASKDKNKDQTYFLWTLTQQQLAHIIFPIDTYTKPEVRELAKKFGLPTAEKKDSQGLCFIGKLDMKDFLTHYISVTPGDVLDENGAVIGKHAGATLYTIGERHGFTIFTKKTDEHPRYVVHKNLEKNTITVAEHKMHNLTRGMVQDVLHLTNTNWVRGAVPLEDTTYYARTRYRQKLFPCTIANTNNIAEITALGPREDAAPGQSLVVYDGEELLGGGVLIS